MTHRSSEPCPFASDNFPIGLFATCCSLRGKVAALELEALHEDALSERMFEDMTTDEAVSFAEELKDAALRLERQYDGKPKPKGAGWDGTYDGKELVWQTISSFEEAIAAIREAAHWYDKVADLGYGVHAWY